MSEGVPQELTPKPSPKFQLSDYRLGTYQPSGDLGEAHLSAKAIAAWEEDNQENFDGKLWGEGQALYFRGVPLTFGRNNQIVDVRFDLDPRENGWPTEADPAVSRRHFEVHPPINDLVKITDLGSTTGIKVVTKEGEQKAILKGVGQAADMELGDFILIGSAIPLEQGGGFRGFRVCKNTQGEVYLVKFKVSKTAELYSLHRIPISEAKAAQIDRESIEVENPAGQEEIALSFEMLRLSIESLRLNIEENRNSPDTLKDYQAVFHNVFQVCQNLAEKYYRGDWVTAAVSLMNYSVNQAKQARGQGDMKRAAYSADVGVILGKLMNHKLIDFTSDQ